MTFVRRLGLCFVFVVVLVVLRATSAEALSVQATDWSSSITSLSPSTEAVSIEVVAGGEAVRLTAQPGHTVVVLGYQNEPYLRITTEGEVQANDRSPTFWANQSATRTGSVPATADTNAEPEWTTIATDGSTLWHDHRAHAMPGIATATHWTILLTVDGVPVIVRGELTRAPTHAPLLEIILAILSSALVVVLGFRWAWRTSTLALLVGSVLSLIVSVGGWFSTPTGFLHPWLHLLVATLAAVLAVGSSLLSQVSSRLRVMVLLAATAALAWWVALNLPALTAAFVPNSLSASIVRFVIAFDSGIVVGVAVIIVVSGGFTDLPTQNQAVVGNESGADSV